MYTAFKRIVALMLCLVLFTGMMPTHVHADDFDHSRQNDSAVRINPLYADVVSEEDLVSVPAVMAAESSEDPVYLTTAAEAGAVIREAMKERQATVTVHYLAPAYSEELHETVFDAALVHTGVPTEGDYLKWQYGGYEVSIGYSNQTDGCYIDFTYAITYYTTAEQEASLDTTVSNLLSSLNLSSASDYEKLQGIYDYICANITYDDANLNVESYKLKFTAYAALVNKTAVCQGYAVLLYRLALALGIDCRVVTGTGNGGAHAWNMAKLGDAYYLLDSTWDAEWKQAGLEYNYFLRGSETFEDHTAESSWSGYAVSTADYNAASAQEYVASGTWGDSLNWTLDADGTMTFTGSGKLSGIPADYEDSVKKLVIGEGITEISDEAAWGMDALEELHIANSVTRIGESAFQDCYELKNIYFGNGLNSIDEYAFYRNTNIEKIYISDLAAWCGVTIVSLNAGLFGSYDFPHTNGTDIYVGGTKVTDLVIPAGVTSIGQYAFGYANVDSITIPDSVTSLSKGSFQWSNAASVTFGTGLTGIATYAFCENNNLESVTVPDGVTAIGTSAFSGCDVLAGINLPNTLKTVGAEAFSSAAAKTLTIPYSVTTISTRAFSFIDELETLTFRGSKPTLETEVFYAVSRAHKPAAYYPQGDSTWDGIDADTTMNWSAYVLCESGHSYGEDNVCAVCGKVRTLITINMTDLGANGWSGNKILVYENNTLAHEVTLDSGSSGSWSIEYDSSKSYEFVWSKSSDHYSHEQCGCKILLGQEVLFNKDYTYFTNCYDGTVLCTICEHTWQDATCTDAQTCSKCGQTQGSAFGHDMGDWILGEDLLERSDCSRCDYYETRETGLIAAGACGENLKWTLDEEGTLTISGAGAMTDYTSGSNVPWYAHRASVQSAVIGNEVTSIGYYAFYNCGSLTSVAIPKSVTAIGWAAFYNCERLTDITIPEGITEINNQTFFGCTNLKTITLPSSLTAIGSLAFSSCNGLTDVYYGGTEAQWGAVTIGTGNDPLLAAAMHYNDPCADGHDYDSLGVCTGCGLIGGACGENLTWTLIDGTLTLSGTGDMMDFTSGLQSPWAVYGYYTTVKKIVIESGITSIGDYAFYSCSKATSVEIPDTVTTIGDFAFEFCGSLTSIEIPGSVTSIGALAFAECGSLESVEIPDSVTSLGGAAFSGCENLVSVNIPNSITAIGEQMFSGCGSLKSIGIPASVAGIGDRAFYDCTSLTEVYITDLTAWLNISYSGQYNHPLTRNNLAKKLYLNGELITDLVIPEGVTSISAGAFYYCDSLTSVIIPTSVTEIGTNAFYTCGSLIEVYFGGTESAWTALGENVPEAGYIHYSCTNPEGHWVAESTEASCTADGYTREACACGHKRNEATTPMLGHDMGDWILGSDGKERSDCSRCDYYETRETGLIAAGACGENLKWTLDEEGTLTISGTGAMTDYSADAGSANVPSWTNYKDSIKSLVVEDGVTHIGNDAFYSYKNLAAAELADSLESIGNHAFYSTGLTEITIPEGVASIGKFAFTNSLSLVTVSIPGTVQEIGAEAFRTCNKLTTVTLGEGIPMIGERMFGACISLKNIEIPTSVTSIGAHAFDGCTALDVRLDLSNVTEIGEWAFYDCSFTEIQLGSGLQTIGASAFQSCDELTDVYYSGTESGWTALGENAPAATYVHYSCTNPEGHWASESADATCVADGYTRDACACGYVRNEVITEATGEHNYVNNVCAMCNKRVYTYTWELVGMTINGEHSGSVTVETTSYTATLVPDVGYYLPGSVKAGDYSSTNTYLGPKYDKTTGTVTWSSSYAALSGTAVPAGAMIGETYYETVCDALEVANDTNATVKLLKDNISGAPENFEITGNVTVDLNGFRFWSGGYTNGVGSISGLIVREGGSLTLTGTGLLFGENVDGYAVENYGTLKIGSGISKAIWESGTTNDLLGYGYAVKNYGVAEIHGVTGEIWNAGTITINADYTYGTIDNTEGGTMYITGGTYSGTRYGAVNNRFGDMYITGGTFTKAINGSSGNIYINGGIFEKEINLSIDNTTTPGTVYSLNVQISSAQFPNGLKITHYDENPSTIADILAENTYVQADGKMVGDLAVTEITGNVIIGPECLHDWDEATCTTAKTCPVCGKTEGDPLGHSYESVITAPTCTEAGFTTHTCAVCGDSYVDTYVDASGHVYVDTVTAPTCTEAGYTTHACSGCGISYTDSPVDALGHDMGDWILWTDALEYSYCSRCDYVETRNTDYVAVGSCGENLIWYLDAEGKLTISGTGAMTDYSSTAPAPWRAHITKIKTVQIDSGVTTVGSYAFYGCTKLTDITLAESVTEIHDYAFYKCIGLTAFVIPEGVTEIGDYVFEECSGLTSINFPAGLTSVGYSVFNGCAKLTDLYITDLTKWINMSAYRGSTNANTLGKKLYLNGELITNLVIPEGITEITPYAFAYCSSLRSVTIPEGVTRIAENAFIGCSGITDVSIPESVLTIGSSAFYGCSSLTDIKIPNSVIEIADSTFGHCSALTSVQLPEYLISVGDTAFIACTSLKHIEIPNDVDEIGYAMFSGCTSLESVVLPDSLTSIGQSAFSGCTSLKSITLPNALTNIGSSAFSNSGLTNIVIPENVTCIDPYAFYQCGHLESVTFAGGKVQIGNDAFRECRSLKGIVLPDGLTKIEYLTFYNCSSMTYVVIPESLTTIGNSAFSGCDSLTDVYYGGTEEKWQTLGSELDVSYVHYSCLNPVGHWTTESAKVTCVTDGYYRGSCACGYEFNEVEEALGHDMGEWVLIEDDLQRRDCSRCDHYEVIEVNVIAFGACGENLTWKLYDDGELCISGTGDMYDYVLDELPWYEHRDAILTVVIEDGVTGIGNTAFYGCGNLTSVTIGDNVSRIGSNAFYGCSNLTTVRIPDSVTAIDGYAFYNCDSLTNVYIEDLAAWLNITHGGDSSNPLVANELDKKLYLNGALLTDLVIPEGIVNINHGAFAYCTDVKSVKLPDSVITIGAAAFRRCGMTSVTIPEGVSSLGNSAFLDCASLESVKLPDSLRLLGYQAFLRCSSLKSIVIPDGITTIDTYTFGHCTSLESIVIPASVTSIRDLAFYKCSSLTDVYFGGTEEQWIALSNRPGATYLHYSCTTSEGHWAADSKEATCDLDGYIREACACGHTRNEEILPALGHDLGDWEPYDDGLERSVCSRCDYSETRESALPTTGSCGENLIWVFDKVTGTLTISGEGDMTEYYGDAPWEVWQQDIRNLIIEPGVTDIGSSAFWGCDQMTNAVIPETVTGIGGSAFCFCSSLTSIIIPESVTGIGSFAFEYCTGLKEVHFMGDAPINGNGVFSGVTATAYYPADNTTWTEIIMQNYGGTITWVPVADDAPAKPEVPVVKASSDVATGKPKLSWAKVEGAAKYEVYRSTSKNGTYKWLATVTGTSQINKNAVTGTRYYYKVRSVAADGTKSDWSNIVSRTSDLARPVVKISNDAATGKPKLTWAAIEGATKYQVYRSTDGASWSWLATVTGTSQINKNAVTGTKYYYKVRALHSNTEANSAYSTVVSRTSDLARPVVKISNDAATGKPKLSWAAIEGATKYQVYRSTDGENWSWLANVTDTSLTNKNAVAGTKYYYKVRAVYSNTDANSAYSAVVSRTCDLARPTLTVELNSSGKPKLSWNAIEGATKYQVYRSTDGENWDWLATVTGTTQTNKNAVAGTKYFYKVRAVHSNSDATSAYSSSKFITAK